MHKPIGSIFTLVGGGTPSTKDERYWGNGIPWFSSADIDRFGAIKYRKTVTELGVENSTTNIVEQGIVVVVTRVGLGKVALLPCDMCFSQDIQALIPKNTGEVFGPFAFYQLQYIMQSLRYKGQGTTISGITKKQLADVNFYLPVHSEQERIVSKIGELLSKLDASVAELQTANEKLKVYRQAVLKEAFEQAISMDSKEMTIDNLLVKTRKGMSTGPFGTMLKKHEHQSTGIPVLGIENIGEGEFIPGNKIFVTPEKALELQAFRLHAGDIIISRSGTVGELCIVPSYMENALLSTNLMRISLDEEIVLPRYFVYLFRSKGVVVDQVKELCKGSTRMFLNQTILKQIRFPIPTIPVQQKLIELVESRLSICDSIQQTIDTSLQQAEALRQSVLKQAFEGRLV